MKAIPAGLALGGLDPSGAAGVIADVRTLSAFGMHPMAIATALTAQSVQSMKGYRPVDAQWIGEQWDVLVKEIMPSCVKIGMLADEKIVELVAKKLEDLGGEIPVVLDPVLAAGAGGSLLGDEGRKKMNKLLLPLVSVVTPNVPEAELMAGMRIAGEADARAAAEKIAATGAGAVLIKGGHLPGDAVDCLFDGKDHHRLPGLRKPGANVRGTGCVFASGLAARLAFGDALLDAARKAKNFVTMYIEGAYSVSEGRHQIGSLARDLKIKPR